MDKLNPKTCKLIACATVIEELLPLMPPQLIYEVLEFGLHSNPERLKNSLQASIDSSPSNIKTVLLGYGLCSHAAIGLKSETCTLVIPRVDDCISIFLGSVDQYHRQQHQEPGTLYLTKGWIEAGNPLNDHAEMVRRYGKKKAEFLLNKMIRHYKRLVFIDTGNYELEQYRIRSQEMAERLNLRYEEIKSTNSLARKLLSGPWDDDFVVVPPGHATSFSDFRKI